eukprot:2919099-Amphidinium_carterae.1
MAEKDALDLTSMTNIEERSDSVNVHQRRKRRASGGALSKQDLDAGLHDLAAKLEKSFDKISTDVAKELVMVRTLAETAKNTAERAVSSTEQLADEVKELKTRVRELSITPPLTPRQAAVGAPSASTPGATFTARRLVVSGWEQKQHRSTLIQEVELGISASDHPEELKKSIKVWAPRVYGKIVLLEVPEGFNVQETKLKLEQQLQEKGLKVKGDRSPAERHRTSCLVSGAKVLDEYLQRHGETKAEICFGEGVLWASGQVEVGRYSRDKGTWSWHKTNLERIFGSEVGEAIAATPMPTSRG